MALTVASEDVAGSWIAPDDGDIYMTTKGAFSVRGIKGDRDDVFAFLPTRLGPSTAGSFAAFWDGDAHGFGGPVDGIHVVMESATNG